VGASGVRAPVPKVIRPPHRVIHALFYDPRNHYLDGRTRIARTLRDIAFALLDPFRDPAPAGAMLLARRAAYKALRLAAFEHHVLTGKDAPAKTSDEAYLSISNSLRQDIETLHRLLKDGGPEDRVPDLQEYLEDLKKASNTAPVEVKAEPERACKCGAGGCGHEKTTPFQDQEERDDD
jgi:hypothetical protein